MFFTGKQKPLLSFTSFMRISSGSESSDEWLWLRTREPEKSLPYHIGEGYMAVFFSIKTLSMISVSSISIVSATLDVTLLAEVLLGVALYLLDTMESKYDCFFFFCAQQVYDATMHKINVMAYRAMFAGIICSVLFFRLIIALRH